MGISSTRRAGALIAVLVGVSAIAGCSGGDTKVSTATVPATIDLAANPDGGSFQVLSYNVAGLPAEISRSHPDVNLPLISPLLNDDDIVLTQEDYDWWAPNGLAAGFDFVNYHGRLRADVRQSYQSPQHPGPKAVGVNRPGLELGDGLGLLSNLPTKGDERVPWTGCFGGLNQNDGGKADCLAMKGFQVSVITLPNGAQIHLYNINAEAGTNPRDQALQVADFEQLADHIVKHAKGAAVIVGGDTNLHLDPEDPASNHGQDGRVWGDFLKRTGLTDACEAGSCRDLGLIDRIVYRSGKGVDLEATSQQLRTDRFVDADGQPLSDNPPVEVTFGWKPA
ncbi:endonuclease/exonuclease/phosphatase family protein [Aquihabitans sp. McL0605]|uniref:endonuclease/exonuclease/phosphatase family protein n=1 Tax=Aquihabitans sp. McL0605 TaxID=3415671 RepID=UPI003CFB59B5